VASLHSLLLLLHQVLLSLHIRINHMQMHTREMGLDLRQRLTQQLVPDLDNMSLIWRDRALDEASPQTMVHHVLAPSRIANTDVSLDPHTILGTRMGHR